MDILQGSVAITVYITVLDNRVMNNNKQQRHDSCPPIIPVDAASSVGGGAAGGRRQRMRIAGHPLDPTYRQGRRGVFNLRALHVTGKRVKELPAGQQRYQPWPTRRTPDTLRTAGASSLTRILTPRSGRLWMHWSRSPRTGKRGRCASVPLSRPPQQSRSHRSRPLRLGLRLP